MAETVNAFNSDRGKGWTEKVADAFANIGHGNNFQRMIDEMEGYRSNIPYDSYVWR